ncbi:DUF397 domain-containing protein [Actinomadura sediminis]|uniref:DUF397 domain-containing protein n=1 Tax=Actinomadura sediminis TaxID=1038904 RepID=A0ABW3EPB3_9ACTN
MSVWRKSSYTGSANDEVCVEVADMGGAIAVRDSKDPDGPRLGFAREAFGGLLDRIRRGEFDR